MPFKFRLGAIQCIRSGSVSMSDCARALVARLTNAPEVPKWRKKMHAPVRGVRENMARSLILTFMLSGHCKSGAEAAAEKRADNCKRSSEVLHFVALLPSGLNKYEASRETHVRANINITVSLLLCAAVSTRCARVCVPSSHADSDCASGDLCAANA